MMKRRKITVNLTEFEAKVMERALHELLYNIDMQHCIDQGEKYPAHELHDVVAARRIDKKLEKLKCSS